MKPAVSLLRNAILPVCVLLLAACTHLPQKQDDKKAVSTEASVNDDPYEDFNRAVFKFNHGFDTVVLRPITTGYRFIVPERGRTMVDNAITNIYSPVTFANSIFQADPENSLATLWRFMINSTFGIGGLFDVATDIGLKNRVTDFGQTLAIYDTPSGPYFVIPIIGPSTTRDSFGRLVDIFDNPFNYISDTFSISMWTATAIDQRSNNMKLLDDIYDTSLDPYATIRSGYIQKRNEAIRRAKIARKKAQDEALCNSSH